MAGINVEYKGNIQIIYFARPEKRNAIDAQMMECIISLLHKATDDDNVLMTIFTGYGDFYSYGSDITLPMAEDIEDHLSRGLSIFQKLVATLIDYPKMLVAILNGPAIGMAATTLALCDIVYASDKAWILTPFSKLGLVPEGCSTYTFPRIMGPAKANKLLYLGEVMTASEALSCGLITEVFPSEETEQLSFVRIQELSRLSPQSLMMTKQLVRGWDKNVLHQVNQAEVDVHKKAFMNEFVFNSKL